jgi:hypothetical protein
MELQWLWISTILLGNVVGVFAWTTCSGIPVATRCRSTSRLVRQEHVHGSAQPYHPPSHDPGVPDDNAVCTDASPRVETTPVSTPAAVTRNTNRALWMDRVQQLQAYCATHGNTLVPKRFKANPPLGNWVNKQRQTYRKFLRGEQPCSMTSQHVDILNSIGFCWDASNVTTATTATTAATMASSSILSDGEPTGDVDDAWWSRLKELERYMASIDNNSSKSNNNVTCLVNISRHDESSPPTPMRAWIREQRRDMDRLSVAQTEALSAIDPDWWKSQRQVQWDVRYQQLREYKQEYGDCCVPISYANKQLAHWVHNQRKQYNNSRQGKASDLTADRLQRLRDIGFVWNRWEYEFTKKQVQTGYMYK